MAGTLVDFPEVMRCGQQEKNKGLVRKVELCGHLVQFFKKYQVYITSTLRYMEFY